MRRRPGTVTARVVTAVAGLLLVLAGALVLAPAVLEQWPWGRPELPWDITGRAAAALAQQNAPVVAAVTAAILLVLVAGWAIRRLRLLSRPAHTVTRDASVLVGVEPGAVTAAAAHVCADDPQVVRARFAFVRRRRRTVLEGTVTVAATADLARVADLVEQVAAQARDMLGAEDAVGDIRLALTGREAPRRIG
ncbi:hypothetical protein IM660_00890 [Ruania alkalisoli]|uniref:Alkaline shock response membrane anchor protein AmaP n=1 Tax=Ruania alkalisoli TaxID=2779775 RepID=A0A7M1STK4_9MICO|nr:hypothetical protein [Ruania alkalisoli]QOR70909.1 hypothetical protein IM660_00890 [Ruania alkalisoli]